jgi:hypothetical protein
MDTYYTKLPLRKVVEIRYEGGRPVEVYECGHAFFAPMNPYSGVKKAKRRRCAWCDPTGPFAGADRQRQNDIRDGRLYD